MRQSSTRYFTILYLIIAAYLCWKDNIMTDKGVSNMNLGVSHWKKRVRLRNSSETKFVYISFHSFGIDEEYKYFSTIVMGISIIFLHTLILPLLPCFWWRDYQVEHLNLATGYIFAAQWRGSRHCQHDPNIHRLGWRSFSSNIHFNRFSKTEGTCTNQSIICSGLECMWSRFFHTHW